MFPCGQLNALPVWQEHQCSGNGILLGASRQEAPSDPVPVMAASLLGGTSVFNHVIFALCHINVPSFTTLLIQAKACSLSLSLLTGSLSHFQCIS